jgi:hypothetical protein
MSTKKFLVAFLLSLVLVSSSRPTLAQEAKNTSDNDVLAQMQSEGWRIVKNGVLQRELRAGEVESFVFGPEGFTWKLQDLRQQLRKLQREFQARPTPELQKAVAGFRKEIANTQKMVERARTAEVLGETAIDTKTTCSINFAYDASASYGATVQGTWGNASANFTGTCGFTGDVYATAYSKVTVAGAPTTKTVTDGPRSGANVSATAYASLNGGSVCESTAYASMTSSSLNPSSYTKSASNSVCPGSPTPPGVTITASPASSSTAPIQLLDSDCVTVTWTATHSGGSTPYTTTIFVSGVSVGNVSSYSRLYCNTGTLLLQTIPAYATVTDGSSQTVTSSTVNTYIQNHRVIISGCLVNGPVPCQ